MLSHILLRPFLRYFAMSASSWFNTYTNKLISRCEHSLYHSEVQAIPITHTPCATSVYIPPSTKQHLDCRRYLGTLSSIAHNTARRTRPPRWLQCQRILRAVTTLKSTNSTDTFHVHVTNPTLIVVHLLLLQHIAHSQRL